MIGIAWDSTSFRAFRIGAGGVIRDRRASARGVQAVTDGRFGDTLREEVGPWLAAGESRVLLAGAIGGQGGWMATPFLPCPAGPAEIAHALTTVEFDWAEVRILPGLSCAGPDGTPDMLRGQEAWIAGALAMLGPGGLACVPGPRSAWAVIEAGRIARFQTHLTGEIFAAMRPMLGVRRLPREGISDPDAFHAGLARTAQPGSLLHHLASVRALLQAGRLPESAVPSYLWGILIGSEVRGALASIATGPLVHVIGPLEATLFYAQAIEAAGCMAEQLDGEAAARGLAVIGAAAGWV